MTTHHTTAHRPDRAGPDGAALERRVVVFTDIVSSTNYIDAHGDLAWLDALTTHLTEAAHQATRFGGEFMKNTGDGTLAVFEDCASAMAYARTIVACSGDSGASSAGDMPPIAADGVQLRVGLACGTVYRWHDDYFGRTVHLAARVCAAAQPGEILMSTTCLEVCAEARAAAGIRRSVELRGFADREDVCADRSISHGSPSHGSAGHGSASTSGEPAPVAVGVLA